MSLRRSDKRGRREFFGSSANRYFKAVGDLSVFWVYIPNAGYVTLFMFVCRRCQQTVK